MRYLYVSYCVVVFCIFFLVLFPFFFLFAALGKWGRRAIWNLLRGWSYVWFFLIGMPVRRVFLSRPTAGRRYIVVANHSSFLDTPFIFRSLPFMTRPLATHEPSRIPLFGFLYRQMAVLVDRSSDQSKTRSLNALRQTLKTESSIFIFPEGGFNETGAPLKRFHRGAFHLALETGHPILPVVFPDTIKRWHYRSFWQWDPGICRAIFLPEIPQEQFKHMEAEELQQLVYRQMEVSLQQYRHDYEPTVRSK